LKDGWKYRVITTLSIIAVVYLLYLLRTVTIPILIAAILAYLLDPVIDKLETLKLSRSTSIILITLAGLLVVVLLLFMLIPAIENELKVAAKSIPLYLKRFKSEVMPWLEEMLGKILPQATFTIDSLLKEGEALFKEVPLDIWNKVLQGIAATFRGTISFFISIIGVMIIPLYLYYILKDFDNLKEGIISLVPFRSRDFITSKFREVDDALSSFIRGQMMICLILAIIYSIGLTIIGIDLSLVIGILSGAAFIIPYLGTLIGGGVAVVMAFLKFHDFVHVIYVLLLFGGAQALEGAIITPKIIGEKMGLHPLVIILSIIIGGEIFGFIGILLAVPAAASLKIFADSALESYRESAYFKEQSS
jgi:predicted PurR-regulated permease PerM